MTCLVGWGLESARDRYRCYGDGELTRGNFRLLPWTSVADRVRRRRMPPASREHSMLGFSQVTPPRTSVAASAPGNRDADGCDCPITGLKRLIRHQPSGKPDGQPHPV